MSARRVCVSVLETELWWLVMRALVEARLRQGALGIPPAPHQPWPLAHPLITLHLEYARRGPFRGRQREGEGGRGTWCISSGTWASEGRGRTGHSCFRSL